MKMAEIDRDLRDCDPKVRYHMTRLQESINETDRRLNQCAELLVKVVDALNELRLVNLKLNDRWTKKLRGEPDFDLVHSVLPDPED